MGIVSVCGDRSLAGSVDHVFETLEWWLEF